MWSKFYFKGKFNTKTVIIDIKNFCIKEKFINNKSHCSFIYLSKKEIVFSIYLNNNVMKYI